MDKEKRKTTWYHRYLNDLLFGVFTSIFECQAAQSGSLFDMFTIFNCASCCLEWSFLTLLSAISINDLSNSCGVFAFAPGWRDPVSLVKAKKTFTLSRFCAFEICVKQTNKHVPSMTRRCPGKCFVQKIIDLWYPYEFNGFPVYHGTNIWYLFIPQSVYACVWKWIRTMGNTWGTSQTLAIYQINIFTYIVFNPNKINKIESQQSPRPRPWGGINIQCYYLGISMVKQCVFQTGLPLINHQNLKWNE